MYMLGNDGLRNVLDVTLSTLEYIHLMGINVKAAYGESASSKEERERQAHVTQPDDADRGGFRLDFGLKSSQ